MRWQSPGDALPLAVTFDAAIESPIADIPPFAGQPDVNVRRLSAVMASPG
jgi:hypothetical protein